MPGIFRLSHYLHQPGEKQPLLLLEPVLTAATVRARSDGGTAACQWYLYDKTENCRAVELRRLQPLCRSRDAQRRLLRELRQNRLGAAQQHSPGTPRSGPSFGSGQNDPTDPGDLNGLWQAHVKGIALRHLAQGQLIATEGNWLVNERSFYALLPAAGQELSETADSSRLLTENAAEQRIELCERSTGRSSSGLLTVLEQYPQQLLLCRLRLEQRALYSMNQLLSPRQTLYGLRFSGRVGELSAAPGPSVPELRSILLFAPVQQVADSFVLHKFLSTHRAVWRARPGDLLVKSPEPLQVLQYLSIDFIGWGAVSVITGTADGKTMGLINAGDWQQVGGWSLKRELLQKHARYMQRRACRFGGYPIGDLERELSGELPPALFRSLIRYLCEGRAAQSLDPVLGESEQSFRSSCRNVEGYLLAEEAMHPARRRAQRGTLDGGESQASGDAEGRAALSPQGRKLLQDLKAAREQGLSVHSPGGEQDGPLQALLRGGWAVLVEGSRAKARCYAREYGPAPAEETMATVAAETGETKEAEQGCATRMNGAEQSEDLLQILSHYKRRNWRGKPTSPHMPKGRNREPKPWEHGAKQTSDFQTKDKEKRESCKRGSQKQNFRKKSKALCQDRKQGRQDGQGEQKVRKRYRVPAAMRPGRAKGARGMTGSAPKSKLRKSQ